MLSVLELVKPPDLNQARVNKCLIALVNRKIVQKDNSTVRLTSSTSALPSTNAWRRRVLFYTAGTGCRAE